MGSLVAAALVIGLLNTVIRPVIIMLTLPITILSFGLFTLIINGALFYLASRLVDGFHVATFWSAFWAALFFSIVSFILNLILTPAVNMRPNSPSYRYYQKHEDVIDVEGKVEDRNDKD
jgi:putative membrane protein